MHLPGNASRWRPRAAATLACCVLGCSGAAGPGASSDGGTVPGPERSACDHYFDARYTRCRGPSLPAGEAARIRARFETVCDHQIALPGSGVSAGTLEACATALDASACELPDGLPEPCQFRGSLPGGAACTDGIQCASGRCPDRGVVTPDGALGPATCGTCDPPAAVGQACAHEGFSAGCARGEVCVLAAGMERASDPSYTCTATTEVDEGAPCDGLTATCEPGLQCASGQCARLPAAEAGAAAALPWGAPGPGVVADGQPCTASDTCDTFSECFEGKCELLDAVVCE